MDYDDRAVASKAVMRAGRHYAQFTVVSGYDMCLGVIQPGWDVEGGKNESTVSGHRFPSDNSDRIPCQNSLTATPQLAQCAHW